MSCSHKKQTVVAVGDYPHSENFLRDKPVIRVIGCASCGSFKVDVESMMTYQPGRWSNPSLVNQTKFDKLMK